MNRRRLQSARGSQPSARPFITVLLFLSVFAAYSFYVHGPKSSTVNYQQDALLSKRGASALECRDVHDAEDQCAFIRKYCDDDDAGLLDYLGLYYCTLGNAQPLAFILLVLWLGLLFTTIGIAASDFFCINLGTIATILGLSESLAGVTFLAFGNGSPDVFSTFAAMASNSASMAVGELVGAACFITGVVVGSMCLVREIRVERSTYTRDILFFIVAVAFTMAFLTDGRLFFWECWTMVGYYVIYVLTVVTWHWYSTQRKKRKRREGEARSHFYNHHQVHAADELAGEPYRDEPDGDLQDTPRDDDVSALEIGPRIEVDGHDPDMNDLDFEDRDEDQERMAAAEVTRSMRVLRPGKHRTTSMTPIRPSLVGALEFRSALAQLQRESNLQLSSIAERPRPRRGTTSAVRAAAERGEAYSDDEHFQPGRERALSSGHTPVFNSVPPELLIGEAQPDSAAVTAEGTPTGSFTRGTSQTHLYTVGGNLAPPPSAGSSLAASPASVAADAHHGDRSRPKLSLLTPTRNSSQSDLSSPATAFPQYTDSPMAMTPHADTQIPDFSLPPAATAHREPSLTIPRSSSFTSKPVRWWPYSILPAPHVLLATLFPTLQGWREKTYWDKFVSALSVPSIFLLVVTLPVVESASSDEGPIEELMADQAHFRHSAPPSPAIHRPAGSEDEWERYQRRNASRQSSQYGNSPRLASLDRDETLVAQAGQNGIEERPIAVKPVSEAEMSHESDERPSWSRWLVGLQLFTGPLFAVFVFWANTMDEWDNPKRELLRMILYTLLVSLLLLAFMIVFTSEHTPPKHHYVLCFLGFVISIAWISTIAGEVVGVLKAVGVVLDISEALLGLTIFAAGNSVGDLVANITVARLGFPVMAL